MSDHITVGYWNCRGRAGVIFSLLDYCKVPYKTILYNKMDEWYAGDKITFKGAFNNLPYIIDGEETLTESLAMIRYAAIKGNRKDLLGKTTEDETNVDIALNVNKGIFEVVDLLGWFQGNFEAEKENVFKESVNAKLDQVNKVLQNKEWMCGYLTVADFFLFENVEFIYEMDSTKLEPYPNLLAFRQRFLDLPETKAHMQSDNFIKLWLPLEAGWTNIPDHSKKPQHEVIFAYWGVKGVAQPGRYLLEYCKIPYKERVYTSFEEWIKDKETLGFDFPNLPYLIHGDTKMTESLAIYEYIPTIAEKYELNGTDEYEKVEITTLKGVLVDLKKGVAQLVNSVPKESFEKAKEESWERGLLKDKLTRLNRYLGDKEYLLGKITVVDFLLFHMLDCLNEMDHARLAEYPKLATFQQRFAQIPEIKAYRESDRNPKLWFNPERANWYKA